eukprot:GHVN01034762.1.p1 GENE.GHVN01034762.1~~GHVN01034762.1.p1  ORF type:complete len:101 (-),score=9.48 GHVN01034762.1:670-972(-)
MSPIKQEETNNLSIGDKTITSSLCVTWPSAHGSFKGETTMLIRVTLEQTSLREATTQRPAKSPIINTKLNKIESRLMPRPTYSQALDQRHLSFVHSFVKE